QSEINNLARQVHDMVVEELEDNGAEDTGYDNTESGLEATNVQDAIDEVNTKIENIPSVDAYTKQESDSFLADEYYATQTYAVGDYCIHEGGLYVCNTAISTAEAWDASHWTLTDVGSALEAITSIIPTKTSQLQNDSDFAQIDDSSTASNTAWSSEKTTEELTNAIENVTNWYSKEKFDGTFTQWYTDNGKLKQGPGIKSAVIPMKNGKSYKISAKGMFNRFSLDTADVMQINANATRIFFNVNNDIIREYTFQNADNANYLLITLDVASVDFDCDLSVKEVISDGTNTFTVNGLDVVLIEGLPIVSNGNYLKSVYYTDTALCMDGGKISKRYAGKLAICPMKNGLKYDIALSGKVNRLIIAVSNSCAIGGSYTIVYNSGIASLTSVNVKKEYLNSDNYGYLLVYYYLGTPSEEINLNINELSYNGK
ncbi:MAG: hypothetical protein VZS12_11690, partial [Ruminococcus bromii]|nr:hypothetical protein [Ruminococcus bromii]